MISDEELAEKVRAMLEENKGKALTESKIRKALEEELDEKLTTKKDLIRREIENFNEETEEKKLEEENEREGGEEEEEEEEEAAAGEAAVADEDEEEEEEEEHVKEEEDEDYVEEKPRSTRPKRKAAERSSTAMRRGRKEKEPKKGGSSGFSKPVRVSTELADFLGQEEISRPQLTKFMWAYFKEKGLQDPTDKRHIISDDTLRGLLKVDRFNAFGFMKLVKPHILG